MAFGIGWCTNIKAAGVGARHALLGSLMHGEVGDDIISSIFRTWGKVSAKFSVKKGFCGVLANILFSQIY